MDALRNCTTRFWAPVYPHHPMHVPCSLFRVSQIGGLGPNLTFQRDAKQLDEGFSIQSQNIILRRLNSRRMDTNSLMYQEIFLIFSLATFSKNMQVHMQIFQNFSMSTNQLENLAGKTKYAIPFWLKNAFVTND